MYQNEIAFAHLLATFRFISFIDCESSMWFCNSCTYNDTKKPTTTTHWGDTHTHSFLIIHVIIAFAFFLAAFFFSHRNRSSTKRLGVSYQSGVWILYIQLIFFPVFSLLSILKCAFFLLWTNHSNVELRNESVINLTDWTSKLRIFLFVTSEQQKWLCGNST